MLSFSIFQESIEVQKSTEKDALLFARLSLGVEARFLDENSPVPTPPENRSKWRTTIEWYLF